MILMLAYLHRKIRLVLLVSVERIGKTNRPFEAKIKSFFESCLTIFHEIRILELELDAIHDAKNVRVLQLQRVLGALLKELFELKVALVI